MALLQLLKKNNRRIEDIERLLNDGADPNCRDADGNCALHFCAQKKYNIPIDIVRLLVKRKVDVNALNKDGCTPLMLCIFYRGGSEMIRLLLDNRAGVAKESSIAPPYNNLVHLCAYYKDDDVMTIELLRLFIKNGYNLNSIDSFNKETPLITFVRNKCDAKMITVLLEAGAEPNITDAFGCSALHYCPRYRGNDGLAVLKALTYYSGDVNVKNDCGETPLTSFILSDCTIEMIGTLLANGIDPNVKNNMGKTALHYCTKYDRSSVIDIIRILLKYRANINAQDNMGVTPLVQFIVEYKDLDLIRKLLDFRADPNLQDETGDNALHACIKYEGDHLGLAKLLMEFETDVNTVNNFGLTPIMAGIQSAFYREFILLLLRSGADPNLGSRNGESALHMCSYVYDDKTGFEVVKELLKRGADVNAVNKNGETVLMQYVKRPNCQRIITMLLEEDASVVLIEKYASSHQYLQQCSNFRDDYYGPYLAQMFISSGYSVNVRNAEGETPLMSMVRSACNSDIVQMVLSAGADVNAVANNGCTALHYCMNYKGEKVNDVVKLLMEHGVDLDTIDDSGETPLMKMLDTYTNETAIQMLVDAGAAISLPTLKNTRKNSNMLHACANYAPWLAEHLLDTFVNSCFLADTYSDTTWKTPLMCFLENGHRLETIEKLLDADADPHRTDRFGNNCLHYVCVKKGGVYVLPIMKLLLHTRANVNAPGENNRTPLSRYLAMIRKDYNIEQHRAVVKMLLKLGADPNIQDKTGQAALQTFFLSPLMNRVRSAKDGDVARLIETLIVYNAQLTVVCDDTEKPIIDVFIKDENASVLPETFATILKYMLVEDATVWEKYRSSFTSLFITPMRTTFTQLCDAKYAACIEELTRLQTHYIKNNISLYDYCNAMTPRRLGLYFIGSNLNVVNKNELRALFPLYFKLIVAKILVGKRYSEVLSKVNSIRMFSELPSKKTDSSVMLNSYSFQYLASYLTETELLKVIEASHG